MSALLVSAISVVRWWNKKVRNAISGPNSAREPLNRHCWTLDQMVDKDGEGREALSKSRTLQLRQKHVGEVCTLFFKSDPLKIVRARGQYMYDEEGHQYLDCINNVCHVGHCHPAVVKAGAQQMMTLNTNSRFLHDNLVQLAERITALMPPQLCVVYFTNSGSEANDLALQLAHHHTKAKETIVLERAYHGHVISLYDLSTYKLDLMTDGVHNKPDNIHMAPCPDTYRGLYRDVDHPGADFGQLYADEVKHMIDGIKARNKGLCGFMAESLQSCGGQIIYPPGYLQKVFSHVRAAGGVCIMDEVQVGFGRMGSHFWGFEIHDVVPDIVTMGKPMGNGHPIAAVVTTREVSQSLLASGVEYFNTYGGNPVSCAIGLAVLDVIKQDRLQENALDVGTYLLEQSRSLMEKFSIIGNVRGHGLFVGIELVKDRTSREPATEEAAYVIKRMRQSRILLSRDGPDNNVIKFKPPMCFTRGDVDLVLGELDVILGELREQARSLDTASPAQQKCWVPSGPREPLVKKAAAKGGESAPLPKSVPAPLPTSNGLPPTPGLPGTSLISLPDMDPPEGSSGGQPLIQPVC